MDKLPNYRSHFRSIRDEVSAEEWQARVELAACYRLVDYYGMTDLTYNQGIHGAQDQANALVRARVPFSVITGDWRSEEFARAFADWAAAAKAVSALRNNLDDLATRVSSFVEERVYVSGTVRAEALFAGDLQPSEHPPPDQVRRCVTTMLRRYGALWCAARMAQEFGDHPEAAAARMSWALRVVRDCYTRALRPRTRCRPVRARRGVPLDPGDRVERPRCPYPVGRYRRVAERGDKWC